MNVLLTQEVEKLLFAVLVFNLELGQEMVE